MSISVRPVYWVVGSPSMTSVGSLKAIPLSMAKLQSKQPALRGNAV